MLQRGWMPLLDGHPTLPFISFPSPPKHKLHLFPFPFVAVVALSPEISRVLQIHQASLLLQLQDRVLLRQHVGERQSPPTDQQWAIPVTASVSHAAETKKSRSQTSPRYFRTRPWGARTPRLCSSCRWSTTADGWRPRWRGPPGASAGSLPGWRSERPCDRTRLPSPRRSATLTVEKKWQKCPHLFNLLFRKTERQHGFSTYVLRCTRRQPPTSQQLRNSLFLPPCSETDKLVPKQRFSWLLWGSQSCDCTFQTATKFWVTATCDQTWPEPIS